MRIALISPRSLGPDSNPGWFMITKGIRRLVQAAVPGAQFMVVEMLHDEPTHWVAAATCDAAILCGNPRFTLSEDAWWEGPIWQRLLQLQASGVRVIDGWGGSTFRLDSDMTIDEMAAEIRALPRNYKYLEYAGAIHGRITRDPLMQRIYEMEGVTSVQLPCSSWWAAELQTGLRNRHAISLISLRGRPYVADAIRVLHARLEEEYPTDLLASTWDDYLWACNVGLNTVQLVCDHDTLLRMYSTYDKFFAFRIHAAIPAAASGCLVHVAAVDTRVMTCDAFGLPHTSINELGGLVPEYRMGAEPDVGAVVQCLQEMLC